MAVPLFAFARGLAGSFGLALWLGAWQSRIAAVPMR
ncbi:MAG: hypothetical protein ACJARR_002629 [Pseudophaeobacter arcticus]|jgi:hypothetical protein